jgi:hypothetical protein
MHAVGKRRQFFDDLASHEIGTQQRMRQTEDAEDGASTRQSVSPLRARWISKTRGPLRLESLPREADAAAPASRSGRRPPERKEARVGEGLAS